MSAPLHQAVARVQVTAEQIERHPAAGRLGKSATRRAVESAHRDYVQSQSTSSRSEAVYRLTSKVGFLLAEHDQAIESLRSELEAARAALIKIMTPLPVTATPQQYARHIHKIACDALRNTKEQSK